MISLRFCIKRGLWQSREGCYSTVLAATATKDSGQARI